jgi:hypothetical protein
VFNAPAIIRVSAQDLRNHPKGIALITDKDNTPFPFLHRRISFLWHWNETKTGYPVTEADLPVVPAYLGSLEAAGAKILTVSKWFNAATIQVLTIQHSQDRRMHLLKMHSENVIQSRKRIPATAWNTGHVGNSIHEL